MSEKIVMVDAGVPGAPNSYYSEIKTLAASGDIASPPVGAYTLVPDLGYIFFPALGSGLSVVIRTDDSPTTYVTLLDPTEAGQLWSDGSNIFIQNANAPASPEVTVNYIVLNEKP